MFRLDRIDAVEVLDAAAQVPPEARSTDLSRGFFAPSPDAPSARLRLRPAAHWVSEYYPCHDVTRRETDGEQIVEATFHTGDGRWLTRLLLQLGDAAQVLEPSSLASEVAEEARRALAAYGADQT